MSVVVCKLHLEMTTIKDFFKKQDNNNDNDKYFKRCIKALKIQGVSLRNYQVNGVKWMIKRELRKTQDKTDTNNKTNNVRGGL